MAAKIKNLEDLHPTQNPRHPHKRSYLPNNANTHTEALLRSQPSSQRALSSPHSSCKQTFSRPHDPYTEKCCRSQKTSSISLPRPRLIGFIHSPHQTSVDSTMRLATSQEIRTWLHQRGLGGYVPVIDAPPHPDTQEIARRIHPDTVTNNIIRPTLDLKCGGEHEVEMQPHTTLKEYFGMYSISGKAYHTYGGPNKFFGEISRILMEYAFAHKNPTSMPLNKTAIIIREYQGGTVDWGILTGEGVCATLESFQSGKRFLPVMVHYLMVLYPPPSTSPRCALTSLTPPPRREQQKTLALTQVE